jgi:hypothetical protein
MHAILVKCYLLFSQLTCVWFSFQSTPLRLWWLRRHNWPFHQNEQGLSPVASALEQSPLTIYFMKLWCEKSKSKYLGSNRCTKAYQVLSKPANTWVCVRHFIFNHYFTPLSSKPMSTSYAKWFKSTINNSTIVNNSNIIQSYNITPLRVKANS